jgi:selenocysteine-specific elongation factor
VGEWLFAPSAWKAVGERARALLAGYHRDHPLRPGMPREELKSRLGLAPPQFAAVLAGLIEEGAVTEHGGAIALATHHVAVEPAAAGPAQALMKAIGDAPFAPPSLPEALRQTGAGEEVLRALIGSGQLVRLSPDIAFTREAYERALGLVRDIVEAEGGVTVARLRDAMGASRRPVLALLEHLDARRITRRDGDVRTLRSLP